MADYFKGLADDMAAAYKDRTGRIATIQKETAHLIREFEKADKEREANVEALLKQFDEEHAKMSQELLARLKAQEEERAKTTQAEISERASQWQSAVRKMAGVRGRKEGPKAPAEEEEGEEEERKEERKEKRAAKEE